MLYKVGKHRQPNFQNVNTDSVLYQNPVLFQVGREVLSLKDRKYKQFEKKKYFNINIILNGHVNSKW